MFNQLHFKKIHLLISVLVLLNISFIAFLAMSNLGKPVVVNAAPSCQLPSNLNTFSAQHNANLQIDIKTSNPSVPLPNLNLSAQSAQCTNGYDDGFVWNSGYNGALQDALVQSPQINPGSYIGPADIMGYYKAHGNTPPTTYQVMPTVSIGQTQGSGTVYSCPSSGFGLCSSLGGNITRSNNVPSGTISQVNVTYSQIFDCNFSPVSYSISGLPSGWTVTGNNGSVAVANGTSVQVETITVTPPAPTPPQTPTISVSLNCQGASWTTQNFQTGDTVAGYVSIVGSGTQTVATIPVQASPSGTVNSFVSQADQTHNLYYFVMNIYESSGPVGSNISPQVSFYNCVSHTQPPAISVSLNCQGATWSTTNYVTSDNITGYVTDTTTSQQVATIPAQNSWSGTYNAFVSNLTTSHDSYIVTMSVQGGNTATSGSFNFYNCVSHTQAPSITVTLDCQGAAWSTTNYVTSDSITGYVTDTTTNQQVVTLPTQNVGTGTYNAFVSSLTTSQDNYTVTMSVQGGNTATSGSFNFYNCVNHVKPPVISVTLDCQGVAWSTTNYVTSDSITGYVTDTTTGTEAFQIPTQNVGTGTYNVFVSKLTTSQDNYTVTMSVQGGNTATSSPVTFYNCVQHPPVISSVSLACIQSSVNMAIQWQDTASTLQTGDIFYGTIQDTTTNQQVATFNVAASVGTYTWTGANTTDSYTVSGYIQGPNGKSSVVTSSSENITSCQTPTVPAITAISLACQNNTTNNLLINWQATNVPQGEMFTGIILDTTSGTEVATIPNTNANLGAYIWQGSNGKDSYQVSGWLVNTGGAKTNVITTSSVSGDCVPAPVTQTVQQLPQTAGTSPIEMFAAVGGLIIAIGIGLMML